MIYAIGVFAVAILLVSAAYMLISGFVIVLNAISVLLTRISQYGAYLVYRASFGYIKLLVFTNEKGVIVSNTHTPETVQPQAPPKQSGSPPQQLPHKQQSQQQQQQAAQPHRQTSPKHDEPKSFWQQAATAVNTYLERVEIEHASRLKNLEQQRRIIAETGQLPPSHSQPQQSQVQDLQRSLQAINQRLQHMENANGGVSTNALNNLHQKLNTITADIGKLKETVDNDSAYIDRLDDKLAALSNELDKVNQATMF